MVMIDPKLMKDDKAYFTQNNLNNLENELDLNNETLTKLGQYVYSKFQKEQKEEKDQTLRNLILQKLANNGPNQTH